MKTQINRKAFLQISLATTVVGLVGCSGDDLPAGDGDMTGTGGDGAGTGGAGTGGVGTGGAGTGGDAASGGAGTGGAGTGGDAASGGAGTGGDASTGGDSATGGAGTGGDGGGLTCDADITVTSSGNGHTHDLTITAAMLNAGAAVMVETNAGTHKHTVALSVDDIATIKAGGVVKKFTCDGGDHEYVISCDPDAPAPQAPNGMGLLEGFCQPN